MRQPAHSFDSNTGCYGRASGRSRRLLGCGPAAGESPLIATLFRRIPHRLRVKGTHLSGRGCEILICKTTSRVAKTPVLRERIGERRHSILAFVTKVKRQARCRTAQSARKATDCSELISKGLRQRMLAQASFSSRLTM